MNKLLVVFIAISPLYSTEQEIEEFLNSLPKPAFSKETLTIDNPSEPSDEKKCAFSAMLPELSASNSDYKLLLFTSLSLPLESWKEHGCSLKKAGGAFVLRGIPNNSFPLLSRKISELRKAGVEAAILLDPEAFEKYNISAIPALVLTDGKCFDKVSGNIKISEALRLLTREGEARETAKAILEKLEGGW